MSILSLKNFPDYLKDSRLYRKSIKALKGKSEETKKILMIKPIELKLYREFDFSDVYLDEFVDFFAVLMQVEFKKEFYNESSYQYLPDMFIYYLFIHEISPHSLIDNIRHRMVSIKDSHLRNFYDNLILFINEVYNLETFYLLYKNIILYMDYKMEPQKCNRLKIEQLRKSENFTIDKIKDNLYRLSVISCHCYFELEDEEYKYVSKKLRLLRNFELGSISYNYGELKIGNFVIYITYYNKRCLNKL